MVSVGVLVAVMVLVTAGAVRVAGQITSAPKNKASAKTWTSARTAWGEPDLQGIWTSNEANGVPVERPSQFGERGFLTDAEFAQRQKQLEVDIRVTDSAGGVGAGPQQWYEWWRRTSRRSSLVVDPQDGKIPFTPEEVKKNAGRSAEGNPVPASWEDLHTWDRCITRGLPSAMIPTAYNNAYQILQTPGYVVIRYELVDNFRMIPLDGRPHVDQHIRQWQGDSRGRWEGNTLVVDVTNFSNKTKGTLPPNGSYRGGGEAMHLVERFTRVDADTINYEATVEDPTLFTKPWKLTIPLERDDNYRIFEYACHEGNYSMPHRLSGARAQEKAAAAGATKK
jgi:hypothetical protein